MTETQIQLVMKIVLALAVMLGALGLLSYFHRKRARKNSAKIELLNFDETYRRERNRKKKGGAKKRCGAKKRGAAKHEGATP